MAKKETKQVNKPAQKKENKTPQQTPAKPNKKETVEVAETEEVDSNKVNIHAETTKVANSKSKLSLDGRVKLLDLAQRHYIDQPDEDLQYAQEIRKGMNTIIGAGIVATIADAALNGDDTFAFVINNNMYPAIMQIAKDMGVTLPTTKQLENKTSKEEKEKGNVVVTTEGVKLSEEAKAKLEAEKAILNEKPELDPMKIDSEEALKKALAYMIIDGKNKVAQTLIAIVDFMHTYRIENFAKKADNAAEAMTKYDNRNMFEWLSDAFNFVDPTFLYGGLGRGIATVANITKNPIRSFWILRNALTNKEGVVAWDDTSIAYAVQAIAKWYLNHENEELQVKLAKAKEAKDSKEEEAINAKLAKNEETYDIFFNCSAECVTEFANKVVALDKEFCKDLDHIVDMYYPLIKKEDYANYKNLVEAAQIHFGIIYNLFCEPAARLDNYSEANIQELVKFTEEELAANKKAAMKANKEESKN